MRDHFLDKITNTRRCKSKSRAMHRVARTNTPISALTNKNSFTVVVKCLNMWIRHWDGEENFKNWHVYDCSERRFPKWRRQNDEILRAKILGRNEKAARNGAAVPCETGHQCEWGGAWGTWCELPVDAPSTPPRRRGEGMHASPKSTKQLQIKSSLTSGIHAFH